MPLVYLKRSLHGKFSWKFRGSYTAHLRAIVAMMPHTHRVMR